MTIEKVLNEMVVERVAPGGVLLVSLNGKIVLHESFGTTRYQDDGSRAVTKDTIYDIASITKIFTATAMLILADRGEISLDDKLAKFFPRCAYGDKVTVRHFLTHTSGISAWMAKFAEQKPDEMCQAIIQAPLKNEPGAKVEYANVNSYLLGEIIELVSKETLDKFFLKEICRPLGMKETFFNPPGAFFERIAPTEITEKRGLIIGRAHDESADVLGGVAGHAGLFSTAEDLGSLCQMWLSDSQILSERLKKSALLKQVSGNSVGFGLGWMIDCDWMGKTREHIAGHTGFTGPMIAIAPKYGLSIVLLMNSTYPQRTDWHKRWSYYEKIMQTLFENL